MHPRKIRAKWQWKVLKLKMQNAKLKTHNSTFIPLNFPLPIAYRPFKHTLPLALNLDIKIQR